MPKTDFTHFIVSTANIYPPLDTFNKAIGVGSMVADRLKKPIIVYQAIGVINLVNGEPDYTPLKDNPDLPIHAKG